MVQEPFGRVLTEVRSQFGRAAFHLHAYDAMLAVVEKRDELKISGLGNAGGMRRTFLLQIPPCFLAHVALEDRGWNLALENELEGIHRWVEKNHSFLQPMENL